MKKLKNLLLLTAVLAVFAFGGCSSKEKTEPVEPMKASFETKDYDGKNFTASIPANWEVDETTMAPMVAFLNVSESTENFTSNANVNILDLPKEDLGDMSKYVELLKKELENTQEGLIFNVTNSEVINLPSGQGALFELDIKLSSETIKALVDSNKLDKEWLDILNKTGSIDALKDEVYYKQIQIHMPQNNKMAVIGYAFTPASSANNKEITTYLAHHLKVK
ncbi:MULTISPECIES: hypothetical protein [unclassified Clostridium]|uniref:hypothetical protein n=1 Tax=unclassified Clostridium TaxID=2614128 RepID=UPI0025C3ED7B|nr:MULTISPECIES: hypothetical protein [unclassified Clostridium]